MRGDYEEGPLERPRRALDRDLALPHRLQQRRLTSWCRAIDLVREHDVREDRAGYEIEAQLLLVEDARAGDVGRQQVGRALDAAEGAELRFHTRPDLREHRARD